MTLSSTSSTLIIDSHDIPAIKAFSDAPGGRNLEVESEPIAEVQRTAATIAELLDYARADKNQAIVFRKSVEIRDVRTKNSWFNFTCTTGKCRKGVSRKDGGFWCDSCDKSVRFPRPRFRLQLDVKDDSGSTVVLFDEAGEALLHCTARSLLEEHDQDDSDDESVLPRPVQNLIGTRHVFEIKAYTYYHYGDYESFNCSHVITHGGEEVGLQNNDGPPADSGSRGKSKSTKKLVKVANIDTPLKDFENHKRKSTYTV